MDEENSVVSRFLEGNACSQAILTEFSETLGLDHLTALKIAAGFGGGMQTAGVCGAVTGAYMVLGLKFSNQECSKSDGRKKVYEAIKEFNRQFTHLNNTLNCRELLGCDISTPEGKQMANDKDLFKRICPTFIKDSSRILQKIMENSDS